MVYEVKILLEILRMLLPLLLVDLMRINKRQYSVRAVIDRNGL